MTGNNVHIVCQRPSVDRVLPYLARLLADQCGYSLSDKTDASAYVNYYLAYSDAPGKLAERSAAWFTHKDIYAEPKARKWDSVAGRVQLRLSSARQYLDMLRPFGPTARVRPPVDQTQFTINPACSGSKPRVGVSGYVYGDGRKGEKLAGEIARRLGERAQVVASGRGWPEGIACTGYPRARLHVFFQSLTVYFCAATVEGVPMTALEALACGIPSVLPRGVGLLDEISDTPGIERYTAGNADEALAAIGRALRVNPNRQALRAAVAEYTIAAWCEDHRRAFAEMPNA